MLSLVDVDIAVQTAIEANKGSWGVEVSYTNTGTAPLLAIGSPFISVDINVHSFRLASLGEAGNRLGRRNGSLNVTLYMLESTGDRKIKETKDNILTTFEGKQFSGIVFTDASSLPVGSVDGWFAEVLTVNFFYNSEGI